ncbi:MAG: glutamate--tRNA ligase, partial [Candidatus Paceibacterota bacterium]
MSDLRKKIADKILPNLKFSAEDLEEKYPKRKLKEGACVTRIAPSPTGFMHIGNVFSAIINDRIAHQSDGVMFSRIEDTDQKRKVEGAVDIIINFLNEFKIDLDEGEKKDGVETGEYGPYRQSERIEIYQTFLKFLLEKGEAYPCFCSIKDLEEMSKKQEEEKIRPGYRGEWAVCRNLEHEKIWEMLNNGKPYVIRFKSEGNFENKIPVKDLVKGDRELSENDLDIVIQKSDGLPTYHFAHVIDDHLMRTTHVLRADEWFASLPIHLQLFGALGWQAPNYGHISPIQKMDGDSRRKISKRHDPEASVTYYDEEGYPVDAVIEYLLNLANSDFEDWRKENPKLLNREFQLKIERLSGSGALFDFQKLKDVSKEIIAKMTAKEVVEESLKWARKYDLGLAGQLENDKKYSLQIFDIERGGDKSRKDIAKWSDVLYEIGYFFDEIFDSAELYFDKILSGIDKDDQKLIKDKFLETYDEKDSKDEW